MSDVLTLCRDCVFADYRDGKVTDRGCVIGRIEKFRKSGAKVTIVNHDDDNENMITQSYAIDRFCNHCHDWDSSYIKGKSYEEWRKSIREVVRPKVAALIYVEDHSTLMDFLNTLHGINEQTYPFSRVMVILDHDFGSGPQLFIPHLQFQDIPWNIVKIEPEINGGYSSSFDRAIDITVKKLDEKSTMYYTVCRSGETIPNDFIEKLDRTINDEVIPVTGVLGNKTLDTPGGWYAVLLKMHNHPDVAGNHLVNITDKFAWITENCGEHLTITSYEELA